MGRQGTYHKRPTGTGQTIAVTTTEATATIASGVYFVHLWSDANIWIELGGTAYADYRSLPIKSETPYIIPVAPGDVIHAIIDTGTATLQIKPME